METLPETLIEESTSCASKQKASSFSDQKISSTGEADEGVELAGAIFLHPAIQSPGLIGPGTPPSTG